MLETLKNTIHSVNAAIFTGIAGIALIVTGEVFAGSFVLVGSLAAFCWFEFWYVAKLEGIDDEHQQAADVARKAAEGWKAQLDAREEELNAREAAVAQREHLADLWEETHGIK